MPSGGWRAMSEMTLKHNQNMSRRAREKKEERAAKYSFTFCSLITIYVEQFKTSRDYETLRNVAYK